MPAVEYKKLWICSWCDPSSGMTMSQRAQGLSRSAVVTIGQDDLERIFILEAWARRCAPDRLMDKMIETQTKYRPNVFGIDSSGPQLTFAEIFRKEARDRGVQVRLRPTPLKADKTFSIEATIQPVANAGRLFRPREADCIDLKDEWVQFPTGNHRDCLDALACAIRLLPSVLPEWMRQMNRQQLRTYLERTGMARDQIEARLSQHAEFAMRGQ